MCHYAKTSVRNNRLYQSNVLQQIPLADDVRAAVVHNNMLYLKRQPTALQTLSVLLKGWNDHPTIAIDGMNGVGKTHLCTSLNRRYLKVNMLSPVVSSGSSYNYDPLISLQYMMTHINTRATNAVWDRCCYSNLIFYFVHHLMYMYRDKDLKNSETDAFQILNTMALDINLPAIVDYISTVTRVPILFIVCSDIDMVGAALKNRVAINDVYNSKETNYQWAQFYVYKYFSLVLKCPLVDLNDFFTATDVETQQPLFYTVGDVQDFIKKMVDINPRYTNSLGPQLDEEVNNVDLLPLPTITERQNDPLEIATPQPQQQQQPPPPTTTNITADNTTVTPQMTIHLNRSDISCNGNFDLLVKTNPHFNDERFLLTENYDDASTTTLSDSDTDDIESPPKPLKNHTLAVASHEDPIPPSSTSPPNNTLDPLEDLTDFDGYLYTQLFNNLIGRLYDSNDIFLNFSNK